MKRSSLAVFARGITLSLIGIALCPDASTAAIGGGNSAVFTENKGQWDSRVLFKADGAGGLTWWIERDGFTVLYSQRTKTDSQQIKQIERMPSDPFLDPSASSASSAVNRRSHALKFKFVAPASLPVFSTLTPGTEAGATAREVIPSDRLSYNSNYFLGNDHSKWAPNCGNYQRLTLHDVWEGIDVEWRADELFPPRSPGGTQGGAGLVEFDFVVHPGADPRQIGWRIDGLTAEMEVTDDGGELLLPTTVGVLRMALPEAFAYHAESAPDGADEASSDANQIAAKFIPVGDNCLGIALPEGYDSRRKLVVDPLVYSTYLGGSGNESAHAIAPDGQGGVLVAGETSSDDFPATEGAIDRSYNGGVNYGDAFVIRLSSDGSELLYGTYLGGSEDDEAHALVSDGAGGVFVAGETFSNDFPTNEGAFDRSFNGGDGDAFVARLNGDGSELLFGTYVGGGGYDEAHALTPDGSGGVVVAGFTYSDDFPTTEGVFDRSYNGGVNFADAFVSRLSGDGSELLYSTYLGGGSHDFAWALAPDGAGGVFVAGETFSNDFPTTEGAFDRSKNHSYDAFVTRLSGDGSELVFSTYLGGSSKAGANTLVPDGAGGGFVAGETFSNDFPTSEGAFDRSYNGGGFWGLDAFVGRLSGDGSELLYSTYLGGSRDDDYALALAPDGVGGVVVGGYTGSEDFPTTEGAFDRSFNGGRWNAFVDRLSEDLSELLYGTYLEGGRESQIDALMLDETGGVVVAGWTDSDAFPTTEGAYNRSINGGMDVFITDIDLGLLTVGDANDRHGLPTECYLGVPYPNPFNARTRLEFGLPVAGRLSLEVWDLSGRSVATLVSGQRPAGRYEAVWDAGTLPAGVYLARLSANSFTAVRKVVMVK